MRKKPDLIDFIAGGAAAAAEMPVTEGAAILNANAKSSDRITKTIRMSKSLELNLKEETHRRTMQEGRRVTESDLIELALNAYLSTNRNQ
jgi:hypothetical protein